MDGLTQLAKILKERENPSIPSVTIGTVITPPPEVEIRLNERIILKKDRLIFLAHMLNNYIREADINGDMITVKWTDTVKPGDEVSLLPTADEQLYIVLDKAVRL
jgi:hypothetical protein